MTMEEKPKLIIIGSFDLPGFSETLQQLSMFEIIRSQNGSEYQLPSSSPSSCTRSLVRRISSGASTTSSHLGRRGPDNFNSRSRQLATLCFVTDRCFDTQFMDSLANYASAINQAVSTRYLSPQVLIECQRLNIPWPGTTRPVSSLSMQGAVVCFSGFRDKDELMTMAAHVHFMSGSVRKDMSDRVTHLVVKYLSGDKFYMALSQNVPVIKRSWIDAAWKNRDVLPTVSATCAEFVKEHSVPIFYNCVILLLGFSSEEEVDLREDTLRNCGELTEDLEDPRLTHVIVNDQAPTDTFTHLQIKKLNELSSHVCVVRTEWFWCSLQVQFLYRPTKFEYIPKDSQSGQSSSNLLINFTSPSSLLNCTSGGTSSSRVKRRKDMVRDTLAQLASSSDPHANSVRASISYTSILEATSDGSAMETSSMLLNTPDNSGLNSSHKNSSSKRSSKGKSGRRSRSRLSKTSDNASPMTQSGQNKASVKAAHRFARASELNYTESNFVNILNYIINIVYKETVNEDQPGGILIPKKDAELIFNGLMPLYTVHSQMQSELAGLIANWSDDCSIGELIVKHAKTFEKVYPPFVNFYEQTKEAILRCDKQFPRFHAFLKRCQASKESGRQGLTDLLIRPVQRLPSMILLLSDLLKSTPTEHRDHAHLEEAVRVLKEVLTHINEDKRRTEAHVTMFELISDIEGCPPFLLSSYRNFVGSVDCVEFDKHFVGPGEALTLLLFSDYLEIARPRKKTAQAVLAAVAALTDNSQGNTTYQNEPDDGSDIHSINDDSALCTSKNTTVDLTRKPSNPPVRSSVAINNHSSGIMATPSATAARDKSHQLKSYKHVELLPLRSIVKVVDLKDSPRSFALVVAPDLHSPEVYSFTVLASGTGLNIASDKTPANQNSLQDIESPSQCSNNSMEKHLFLKCLLNQLGHVTCQDYRLELLKPQALGLNTSESFLLASLSKAKRIRKRVTRVFSNRNPKVNSAMKRTVSVTPATEGNMEGGLPSTASTSQLSHANKISVGTPKRPLGKSPLSCAQSTPSVPKSHRSATKRSHYLLSLFSGSTQPSGRVISPVPANLDCQRHEMMDVDLLDHHDFLFADENAPADLDNDEFTPIINPDQLFTAPTPPAHFPPAKTSGSSIRTSALHLGVEEDMATSRESLMSCASSYRRPSLLKSIKTRFKDIRRSMIGTRSSISSTKDEVSTSDLTSNPKIKRLSLFRSSARSGQALTISKLSLMDEQGSSSVQTSPRSYDLRSSVMTLPKCDEETEEGPNSLDNDNTPSSRHRLKKHITSLALFSNKR